MNLARQRLMRLAEPTIPIVASIFSSARGSVASMAFRTASAAVILLALPAALGQGLSAVLEQIVHEKARMHVRRAHSHTHTCQAAEYNCSFGIALRMSDGSNPVAVAG